MARYVLVNVDDKADVESFLNSFVDNSDDCDDFVSCCGGGNCCGGVISGCDMGFPSYRRSVHYSSECGITFPSSWVDGCGSSGCGGYSRSRSYTSECGSGGCGGYSRSRSYTSGCGGHGCG